MKNYEVPRMTITKFDIEDVIATSSHIILSTSNVDYTKETNWTDILNNFIN